MTANFLGYALTGQRLDHWDPVVFGTALGCGIAALIGVSLLTPPEPAARLDKFYDNLQTPGGKEGTGQTQLETARAGEQLIIVNLLSLRKGACGLGFFRAYRVDLTGLSIGCACVLALVAGVWLMVR